MTEGIVARLQLARPGFGLDVDLNLPGRGVTAVFGVSGSGKTTLLRCIAGLERATGLLSVNGQTWQDGQHFEPTHRRALGYVFQEASVFAHLDVHANLAYGMKRRASATATPDPGKPDFATVVELLGIGSILKRMPAHLSGGERQRVAIARALLTHPRLLLLDEPLAALDQARKQDILPYLERLRDTLDIPVLYVSHAPDEVARLADHLVVLADGRVVASGPIGSTLARLDLPIRLGDDAGVVLTGVIAERDERWHLVRVHCEGCDFWASDDGHAVGQPVRIRILARDVSVARQAATETSMLNICAAEVVALADETHPGQAMVKLKVGAVEVLARLTRRSVATLALTPGTPVFAQIKAVALIA
jgi:molybdate transport system ATP-binding protein